jgi:pimeloyl-ACP methyl ester carboxylesterase
MMIKANKLSICKVQKSLILFIFLLFFICSCEKEQQTRVAKRVVVVNLQDPYRSLPGYKFTASTRTLKSVFEQNGVQDADSFIKYPVSYHRLVYTTNYNGKQINASGAIAIPVCPDRSPAIVSYQHGTMFANRDAPSESNSAGVFPLFNEYIIFIPDYIGYGESKNILHPYFIYEPSTTPVIDMIKAGKKYLDDNHILYDHDKLFLTGHSEGGYVTVAVQKEMEQNPVEGLKVTASAPSAGPYDVGLIGNLILRENTYPSPAYLIFIFSVYNNFYWQRPLTDFFLPAYASNIMNLLSGYYNEDEINQRLTSTLSWLLNPAFMADYRDDGEKELKEAFKLNSVYNWAPQTPTRLYHGTIDNLVPFEISQKTYESFISNGSDTSVVKLVPIPGIGHEYLPAYKLIHKWFETFK